MRIRTIGAGVALCMGTLAAAAVAQEDIEGRMANADPEKGERLFRQCQSCHTVGQGEPNRVGPNLYGVVGRAVAAAEGFRYSGALGDHGGEWTPDRLDDFLADPRGTVPGTRMSFRGLPDPADRADVIAYLNANGDDPMDFGEAGEEESADGGEPEEDYGQLVVADGVEETYYTCTACHSEMIVAQQGKTREGWDELFDWMIEEQGMAELEQEERDRILDYLAEHYNTDRPNFPRP